MGTEKKRNSSTLKIYTNSLLYHHGFVRVAAKMWIEPAQISDPRKCVPLQHETRPELPILAVPLWSGFSVDDVRTPGICTILPKCKIWWGFFVFGCWSKRPSHGGGSRGCRA